jgi:two-component system CheB/CheR fusion protein
MRQHILRKDGHSASAGPAASSAPPRAGQAAGGAAGRPAGAAFEESMVAQIVLDASATITLANRAARRLLSIGSAEVGRHLHGAAFAGRPADLRGQVDRVLRERRPVTLHDVAWHSSADEPVTLDITAAPLEGQGGIAITFLDVTRYQHLRDDLERSRHELENAYEELQSTVEELETTNEELQSANEELETTNEELHSTNEELETMNEELQSANEELETTNSALRDRSTEVSELNQFLQSILGSMESAVIVLGTDMDVRAWNSRAEDLWGLRAEEVLGQHFLNLDIGFPVERLRAPIRSCLGGKAEREQVTAHAVNRRGRPVTCTVNISCMAGEGPNGGVILIMDCAPPGQVTAGASGVPARESREPQR